MSDILRATFFAASVAACSNTGSLSMSDFPQPQSILDIKGTWDVIEFNGYKPTELSGWGDSSANVVFHEEYTSFRMECNYTGGFLTLTSDGRLVQKNIDEGMDVAVTAMSCGKKRNNRERKFFDFMLSGVQLNQLSSNIIRLEAENSYAVLQDPEVNRIKRAPASISELAGRWYPVATNEGGRGWGSVYTPGHVTVGSKVFTYSKCPNLSIPFEVGQGGKIELVEKAAIQERIDTECSELNDQQNMALDIIINGPKIDVIDAKTWVLIDSNRSITFHKSADY